MNIDNIWNQDSKQAEFIRAYLECLLWASWDDNEDPLDINYTIDEITPSALESSIKDCQRFMFLYERLFPDNYEQAGYDFWLTRNGHGAGFWDRPEIYGKEAATELTGACGHGTLFPEKHAFAQKNKVYVE